MTSNHSGRNPQCRARIPLKDGCPGGLYDQLQLIHSSIKGMCLMEILRAGECQSAAKFAAISSSVAIPKRISCGIGANEKRKTFHYGLPGGRSPEPCKVKFQSLLLNLAKAVGKMGFTSIRRTFDEN
jgi:hypothetical protein